MNIDGIPRDGWRGNDNMWAYKGHLWEVTMVLVSSKFLFIHDAVYKVSNGIQSPPLKRRHITLYCIMINCDQQKANGSHSYWYLDTKVFCFFPLFFYYSSGIVLQGGHKVVNIFNEDVERL